MTVTLLCNNNNNNNNNNNKNIYLGSPLAYAVSVGFSVYSMIKIIQILKRLIETYAAGKCQIFFYLSSKIL